ncbi:MAG: four helix bundle protein [Ignavibacteria bacterium RBG_13_36_8]|nr:MAG: four helix bundle protein [Ignavibacteria bacterium RBG_13_36_8]
MQNYFDHEKLNVYQKSLEFILFVEKIKEKIKIKISAFDNLDRAATSIALNISEGNGKFTSKDRCKYFDISRGSALESASCLDVLFLKKLIDESDINEGKNILKDIVNMLVGLIKSNSDRVYEPREEYE